MKTPANESVFLLAFFFVAKERCTASYSHCVFSHGNMGWIWEEGLLPFPLEKEGVI